MDPSQFKPSPADVVRITGYPPIGKWMISPEMSYADWLGTICLCWMLWRG